MTNQGPWKVVLAGQARSDFDSIVEWTRNAFGPMQASQYAEKLSLRVRRLGKEGTRIPTLKRRDDLKPDIVSWHMCHAGLKGSHILFLCFSEADGEPVVTLLRILHERMDPTYHLE